MLIIGPPGTPYVDAPHLIDFYLDPTKYPFEPPKAHFHSWTSGRGRCSPNLYEEGKVCLSILGTWEGERNESWNPHKSSLLQIFVSIQGLVLVREPYFTEPAFEKLRGTKEARVSSRQYKWVFIRLDFSLVLFADRISVLDPSSPSSEKAFVLTRGFILHALRHPIAGFADEMEHLYVTHGRLGSALKSAQDLITISEASDGVTAEELAQEGTWDEGDGVGRLTKGALIPLKVYLIEELALRQSCAKVSGLTLPSLSSFVCPSSTFSAHNYWSRSALGRTEAETMIDENCSSSSNRFLCALETPRDSACVGVAHEIRKWD